MGQTRSSQATQASPRLLETLNWHVSTVRMHRSLEFGVDEAYDIHVGTPFNFIYDVGPPL